jgi:hypothetical protein
VSLRIPSLCRLGIEIRIGKQAQSDNAAGLAVERSNRNDSIAHANLYPRVFLFVFKWIGWAIGFALVEPETRVVRIRTGRLFKAGIIDQPEILPATVTAVFQRRM